MKIVYYHNYKTGESIPVYVDEGAIGSISYEHLRVHNGEMFRFCYYTTGIAGSGTVILQWTTGTKSVHAVSLFSASGQANIKLYEGVTSTGGTTVPVYNLNRPSILAALTAIKHTPTVSNYGTTILRDEFVPGGSAGGKSGSSSREGTEVILKPSTKYAILITNTGSTAIDLSYTGDFYEED